MQWKEVGVILAVKSFSENARIVTVFNKSLGKITAIFKNTKTPIQKGDVCDIFWRGRSSEHLGTVRIEVAFSPFGCIFQDAAKVFAIDSACALCFGGLFSSAPHEKLFASFLDFVFSIAQDDWIIHYVFFELSLLAEVGYGLDLSKCAITGVKDGLYYVSPKTGRAVTKEAGWAYREKLLFLPKFITSANVVPDKYDIFYALHLTGHFLRQYFYGINEKQLPLSRCIIEDYYRDYDGSKAV